MKNRTLPAHSLAISEFEMMEHKHKHAQVKHPSALRSSQRRFGLIQNRWEQQGRVIVTHVLTSVAMANADSLPGVSS